MRSSSEGNSGLTLALSDEDGNYQMRKPTGAKYELTAGHPDFVAYHTEISIAQAGDAVQDFELEPAATITVKVIDENQKPVPEASIGGPMPGRAGTMTDVGRTDAEGIARIGGLSRATLDSVRVNAKKVGFQAIVH